MFSEQDFIVKCFDLHLFYMRIMKEHLFLLEASFKPNNMGLKEKGTKLREQAIKMLERLVSAANGNVSRSVLNSNELVTPYTLEVEKATSIYAGIPIDTKITVTEQTLQPSADSRAKLNTREMVQLNKEIYNLINTILEYKKGVYEKIAKCAIILDIYPSNIIHMIKETENYQQKVLDLQNMSSIRETNKIIEEEIFWDDIMLEHAEVIRGLLDPSEEQLFKLSNTFVQKFKELLLKTKHTEQRLNKENITYQNLQATEQLKNFKEHGVQGTLSCNIKSVMLPLLIDHVLREANHYIRELNQSM